MPKKWSCNDLGLMLMPAPYGVGPPSDISLFLVGADGHLHEHYHAETWHWADHGRPSATVGVSEVTAAAITDASGRVSAFATGWDGHLWERFYDGSWQWADRGRPATNAWFSSLAAVKTASGQAAAFGRGSDGHLYWYSAGASGSPWQDCGLAMGNIEIPAGVTIAPVSLPSGYVGVFLSAPDGHLYECSSISGSPPQWWDHGLTPQGMRWHAPTAVAASSNEIRVFALVDGGRLNELQFVGGSGWDWHDRGTLPAAVIGDPVVARASSGYMGLFATGDENHLWEFPLDGNGGWDDRGCMGGPHGGHPLSPGVRPTAVAGPSGYLAVFVTGSDWNPHLYECASSAGSGWQWFDHGLSPVYADMYGPVAIAGAPAGVGVFAFGRDKHLYERHFDMGWSLADHGSVALLMMKTWPRLAAAALPEFAGVFLVSVPGDLWARYHERAWQWRPLDTIPGGGPVCGLTAVSVTPGYMGAFMTATNGQLYECSRANGPWTWWEHGLAPGNTCVYEPSAVTAPASYISVFVRGDDGQLYERHFVPGAGWQWREHGLAPGGTCVYEPAAVASPSGYLGVFVRGDDGQLYERYLAGGSHFEWREHGPAPGGVRVARPVALADASGYIGVISRGADGHLYELFLEGTWQWADLGGVLGDAVVSEHLPLASVAAPWGYLGVFFRGEDGRLYEVYA